MRFLSSLGIFLIAVGIVKGTVSLIKMKKQ